MAQWLEGVIGRLRAIEADAEPVSLLPDRVMSVRETFDLLLPLLAPPDPSGTPGPSATAASSPTPGTEPDEAALQQQWFGDDESAQTVFELDQCLRRCLTARPLAAHIFPAPPAAGVYPPPFHVSGTDYDVSEVKRLELVVELCRRILLWSPTAPEPINPSDPLSLMLAYQRFMEAIDGVLFSVAWSFEDYLLAEEGSWSELEEIMYAIPIEPAGAMWWDCSLQEEDALSPIDRLFVAALASEYETEKLTARTILEQYDFTVLDVNEVIEATQHSNEDDEPLLYGLHHLARWWVNDTPVTYLNYTLEEFMSAGWTAWTPDEFRWHVSQWQTAQPYIEVMESIRAHCERMTEEQIGDWIKSVVTNYRN